MLSEAEAKSILQDYGIPTVPTVIAADVDDAVIKARDIGFPVALNLLSRDVTH